MAVNLTFYLSSFGEKIRKNCKNLVPHDFRFGDCEIDLVTVLEVILTSRQRRKKLQCMNENLMSNNFRKKAFLKKKNAV